MIKTFKKIKWRYHLNYITIAIIGIVLMIMSNNGQLERSTQDNLTAITIAILLSVSLGLIVGFLGELSLGHAGFMCVGAFIGGKLANYIKETTDIVIKDSLGALIFCMLIGGLVAALFGALVGLPALRLRGDYLAIVTLAFCQIMFTIFQNLPQDMFGGTMAYSTPKFNRDYLFLVGIATVIVCVIVIQNIMLSKHGRAITSIRDSEIAARATGINVTKYKLLVFIVAAFFAGVAGVLFSFNEYSFEATKFNYLYSIEILVMVVLGGMGSINGSIIAATLITFLDIELRDVFKGNLSVLQDFVFAIILILIVIYNNAPKLKTFREKYNLKNLLSLIFRFKKDPSKIKNDEAKWHRVPTKIEIDEVLSTKIQRDPTTSIKPDRGGKE